MSVDIIVNQSSSGSDLIGTYGSYYKFLSGTAPTLSTAANASDALSMKGVTSTTIYTTFGKDFR
jgi:hypothetical protein